MFPWQAAPSPEPTTATYRRKISLGRPHGRQPPVGGQNFNKTAETDSQWATSQTSYGGHAESWLGKRLSAVARVAARLTKVGGNKTFQEITGPIGRRGIAEPRVKRKSVVLEEPEGMVNDRTWGINQKINLGGSGNVRFAAVAATDAQAAEREGEIEGNSNILSDEGTDIGAAQKTSSAAIQAESNAAPAETTQNNVASEGAAPSADMSTLNPLKRSKPVPVHVSPLMRAAGVPRFPGKIAGVPVADEW